MLAVHGPKSSMPFPVVCREGKLKSRGQICMKFLQSTDFGPVTNRIDSGQLKGAFWDRNYPVSASICVQHLSLLSKLAGLLYFSKYLIFGEKSLKQAK